MSVSRAALAMFGVAVLAFAAHEALLISGHADATLADVRGLLGSLETVRRGSAADVAALRRGAPDLARDRRACDVFAAGIFALNWGTRVLLVQPLASRCVQLTGPQAVKFAQSTMEAVLYGSFAVLGLVVAPSQESVWPSALWWKGFLDGGHEIMRADARCYYLLYASRYFQALVSLMMEFKRKDFLEMIVHHVTTLLVIFISYVYGWNRIGIVIMALMDPADVPLHLAKLCKYTAESSGRQIWQFCADRLFEVFAVTFLTTRLVLYGYVVWSATFESWQFFPRGFKEVLCLVLLWTLLLLQAYWFSLIVKVAMRLMAGVSVEDIRSDDEDEDEDEAKAKKKVK